MNNQVKTPPPASPHNPMQAIADAYAAGKLGPRKGEAKAKPEYSRRRKPWQKGKRK